VVINRDYKFAVAQVLQEQSVCTTQTMVDLVEVQPVGAVQVVAVATAVAVLKYITTIEPAVVVAVLTAPVVLLVVALLTTTTPAM
jgi:hypothetical protein